jgi:glycerophosphoryl diester phosphodiesterase
VIAHRGASAERPENTLPAFERAIELGADFVELDVHARPDGTFAVTHDPPRVDVPTPTLEEALDLCHGRIGVMVELKTPALYSRFDLIGRTLALLRDDDVVVSFDPDAIREVRTRRPELRTVQHVEQVPLAVAHEVDAWSAGFLDRDATESGLASARELGLVPTVFTVNDPERMRELARYGVGGIFTDDPALALATFG